MNSPTHLTALERLIKTAVDQVEQTQGIAPDFTPETLPLVDHHLNSVVALQDVEQRAFSLAAIGCYFGEVVRRRLDARWATPSDNPLGWRIELNSCFLYFSPLAIANEVLVGCETAEFDASFGTLGKHHEAVDSRLKQAPQIGEAEYYSLSSRLEVAELISDFLVGLGAEDERNVFKAADYERELAVNQASSCVH
jgi:hypothetical protein